MQLLYLFVFLPALLVLFMDSLGPGGSTGV